MLTPSFHLSQDDEYLTICISAPFVKISESDIYFDDYYFKFYCAPYFLRINLPGKVVCCEKVPVFYDVDEGTFTVHMQKLTAGQWFDGPDSTTRHFAPKGKPSTSSIGVIGSPLCKDEDFNWGIQQAPVVNDANDKFVLATMQGKDMNLDLVSQPSEEELSLLELNNFSDCVKTGQQVSNDDHMSSTYSSAFCSKATESCLQLKDSNLCEQNSHHTFERPECQNFDPLLSPPVKASTESTCSNAISTNLQSCVVFQTPLDPTKNESDNTSDSGSSSGSYYSSSCQTDSDDFSSSSSEADSDLESSCSDGYDEHCRLLKKDQSCERLR